jgi:Gamma-glutamyl cyclotransferase, AIG2-like
MGWLLFVTSYLPSSMPLLFSYGTLQQQPVQLSTFGRVLQGYPDALVGFELSRVKIEDPAFVAMSGQSDHAIVTFTGNDQDRVSGMVFEITDTELARADAYEPAGYERALAMLASGTEAWVYARAAPSREIY